MSDPYDRCSPVNHGGTVMVFNATFNNLFVKCVNSWKIGRGHHDSMVVGFKTTYVIKAYHH
jgi:hypothetical protein